MIILFGVHVVVAGWSLTIYSIYCSEATALYDFCPDFFIAGQVLRHPRMFDEVIKWESLRQVFGEESFDDRSEPRCRLISCVVKLIAVRLPVFICVIFLKKGKQLVFLIAGPLERKGTHHSHKQEYTQGEHFSWWALVRKTRKHLRGSVTQASCNASEQNLFPVALGVLLTERDCHSKVCNLYPTRGVSEVESAIDEEIFCF